jgi:hypothetical protein
LDSIDEDYSMNGSIRVILNKKIIKGIRRKEES